MKKEEKIKQQWGSYYKSEISSEGWLRVKPSVYANPELFDRLKFNTTEDAIRPKTLKGIENNNGWVKIENEDDLPKDGGDFWIINSYGSLIEASFLLNRKVFFKFGDIKATHYQPIVKPHPPIY